LPAKAGLPLRDAPPVRGAVAQGPLADLSRLDDEMRRHRKIAEQNFADGDVRVF
jgi:hypothetical protein